MLLSFDIKDTTTQQHNGMNGEHEIDNNMIMMMMKILLLTHFSHHRTFSKKNRSVDDWVSQSSSTGFFLL